MALKKEVRAVKFWTPLRIVSTLIVLGLVAAFGASSCYTRNSAPRSTSRPANASAATPALPAVVLDTEMKSVNGDPIKLSNYSGKVLLVNIWATWCGPCRRETPELVRLYREYQDRGLEIVGLTTEDPIASEQNVQAFVRAYNVDYQVGWATREVTMALMRDGRIPQSFIITRDGRIKKHLVGFDPVRTPPQLKQALEEALADSG